MAEEKTDAWDATQWHEVKKGDTLWKIAETYYGDILSCSCQEDKLKNF
jgi:nucleoid-associated protein YgaU